MINRVHSNEPSFIFNSKAPRFDPQKNPYHVYNKNPLKRDEPSIQFRPFRAKEQYRACKQWGNTSNN